MIKQNFLLKVLTYLAVIVLVIYLLAPLLWFLLMSVSSTEMITKKPLDWLPSKLDFSSFQDLLRMGANSRGETFLYGLRNSLKTSFTATLVSLFISIPAGWCFSRHPGKKNIILGGAILFFMLPSVAFALPLYTTLSRNGLLNNSYALAIVYCTFLTPFCIWLTKENMDTVPFALEEAAIIDGANLFQRLVIVVLPLMLPALGTVSLLAMIMAWDEYFYALLYTSDDQSQTISVVIANLASGRQSNYNLIAAAGVLAALPPVLVGLLLQKSLVHGLTTGGIKG